MGVRTIIPPEPISPRAWNTGRRGSHSTSFSRTLSRSPGPSSCLPQQVGLAELGSRNRPPQLPPPGLLISKGLREMLLAVSMMPMGGLRLWPAPSSLGDAASATRFAGLTGKGETKHCSKKKKKKITKNLKAVKERIGSSAGGSWVWDPGRLCSSHGWEAGWAQGALDMPPSSEWRAPGPGMFYPGS